jgi:glycosyltransferase involved in cell wall biosynthesis
LKVLVIIPAFNEGRHLKECLESFAQQTYQNIEFVVVNDASTDDTQSIVEDFIKNVPNFKLINLTNKPEHKPGAKVVRTFHAGLNSITPADYEVIAKFDADIILPPDYFEIMISELEKNPKIGIIGGLVYIEKNGKWIYENISGKNHVRGPIKTYRRECFEEIGGLRETLGWDNLDILLARMHGWETKVVADVWVKHLKPTAQVYKKSKAEKLGEYFYNIGLDKKLAFISSAKAAWKEKSLKNFIISYKAFLSSEKKKKERKISPEEIDFIRKYRWNEMRKKFRLLI